MFSWLRNLWAFLAPPSPGGAAPVRAVPPARPAPRPANPPPRVPGTNPALRTDVPRPSPPPLTQSLAETLRCSEAELALRAQAEADAEDQYQIEAALHALKQIPALKSLADKFTRSLGRETIEIDEVVASLSHDPSLCVRILRMANSVAIASREPVSDLPTAVHLLGVNRVRMMSHALLLQRDTEGIAQGFDWKHLWMHALATAMLAERLDTWSGRHAAPSLQVCAILHDVGKIALSVVAPVAYPGILLAAWQTQASLPPLEVSRLGLDHREAGRIFGQESGLPPIVLDAIAHHDTPALAAPENQSTVALVGVANQWAKLYGLGFSGDGSSQPVDLWETPAWAAWARTLPDLPDPTAFALREPAWLDQVRHELAAFHS